MKAPTDCLGNQSKIYDLAKVGKVRIATLVVTLSTVAGIDTIIRPFPHCY